MIGLTITLTLFLREIILKVFYLAFLLLLVTSTVSLARQSVGIVKFVSGSAYLQSGESKARAYPHMRIFLGDQIFTAERSSIGLIFEDDTVLSLGPNSSILIEKFLFDPAGNNLSFVARMIEGTFSFITGQIAKLAPEKVMLETPDATLGVRGTKFLVKIE